MPVARKSQGSLFENANRIMHLFWLLPQLKCMSQPIQKIDYEVFLISEQTFFSAPFNSFFRPDGWQVK